MVFTLYGYEGNPRTRLVRIVAAAEGVELNHSEVIPRQNVGKAAYIEEFPLSMGKIPGLRGPSIKITETIAIVTYLSKLSDNCNLLGNGSKEQEAEVLSWMSWANQELLPILARWFLPLIPNLKDPAPYQKDAVESGKIASLRILDTLEGIIASRKYLVGDNVTIADFMVAIFVSRGLQWVLGAQWRETHPHTMGHFYMVSAKSSVRSVIPKFVFVDEEPPIQDPYAVNGGP